MPRRDDFSWRWWAYASAAIVITIAVAIAGLVPLDAIQRTSRRIVAEHVQDLHLVRDLQLAFDDSTAAGNAFLLTGDAHYRESRHAARERFARTLDHMLRVVDDEETEGLLVAADLEERRSQIVFEELARQRTAKPWTGTELEHHFEDEIAPARERVQKALERIDARERSVLEAARMEARAEIERARNYVLIAVGTSILALLALSALTARSLRQVFEGQRRAALEAEASRVEMATLLDNVPAGVLVLQAGNGLLLEANDQAEKLLGMPKAELVGRPVAAVLSGSMPSKDLRSLRDGALFSGAGLTVGDTTVLARAALVRVPGDAARVVVMLNDVTEQARQRTLQELLAEAGRALSLSLDREGICGALARLLGDRLGGACIIDLVEPNGEPGPRVVYHRDPGRATELRSAPVGQPLAAEPGADVSAHMQVGHRKLGLVTVVTDPPRQLLPHERDAVENVAARAAFVLENARLYASARHEAAAREELVAVVSHDLRSPLAVVEMTASLLADEGNEDGQRAAGPLSRAAQQMRGLIDTVLDAALLESGQMPMKTEPNDLRRLVSDAADMFREQAAQRHLRLDLELGSRPARVEADPVRLMQAVCNLIANALKFTADNGRVCLQIQADDQDVLLRVTDTGRGIPQEQMSRLFERYWRADRERGGSLGLGLYITRGIVEAHGGRIFAESRVGVGTSFTIRLAALGREHAVANARA